MTDISQFQQSAITYMQKEISATGGNEVFFVARKGADQLISEVTAVARGKEDEVPVIYDQAFRGDFVIHNHPTGNLTPSDNDIAIASYLGNQGVGFLIIDNAVSRCYTVVEGVEAIERVYLDAEELASLIDKGGKIVKYFDRFEKRDPQIKMLKAIAEAFNDDDVALIEAGTGVGKSMAYLIPAIYWAVENKEKVVISTNTINLQEQICNKDIPFLQKALEMDFKAVLMKGRGNYLCLRKLYSVKEDPQNELFETEESDWAESVIKALDSLKEGSRDELSGIIPSNAWEKIASETDTCLKGRCQYFSDCFFFKARKEVNEANLIIVNHHLLCSDIAIKGGGDDSVSYGVLPAYQKLVIDEAHNLENVAIHYLGHAVSHYSFKQAVSRLYRLKGSMEKGLLIKLRHELQKATSESDYATVDESLELLKEEVIPNIFRLNPVIDEFFQLILDYIEKKLEQNSYETTFRLLPDSKFGAAQTKIKDITEQLVKSVTVVYDRINQFTSRLAEVPHHIKESWIPLIKDLEAYQDRLFAAMANVETFVQFKLNDSVYWIELRRLKNFNWVRLNVSPLNIAELLHDYLFSNKETITLTSATLTTNNDFHFLKQELGLLEMPESRIRELILESPFDYKKQMSICIPTDLPSPQDKNYNSEAIDFLIEVVEATKGKTFILFTSYGMLNQAYNRLEEHFNGSLTLLKQGSMDRHRLLDRFKNGNESILLGTDSFWEGVDVPGDALQCVVLTKLPFKVPTEPITQAKVEKIEKEGGNSFYDYSIPQSVIKFRQGFGRLIRTNDDKGVVICMDKRIVTKSYGKIFLNSLPPCRQVIGEGYEVLQELNRYF